MTDSSVQRARDLVLRAFLPLAFVVSAAPSAYGGLLVSPSAHWTTYSFRPTGDADTANYYGVGAGLNLGYSAGQSLDFAGVVRYSQARANSIVKILAKDSTLMFFGAEIAARMSQTVYAAVRAGSVTRNVTSAKLDAEVEGLWRGTAYGVSLGAILPGAGKSKFSQVSMSFLGATGMRCSSGCPTNWDTQRLDTFSVDFAYVFNQYESARSDDSMFGSYLKGIFSW